MSKRSRSYNKSNGSTNTNYGGKVGSQVSGISDDSSYFLTDQIKRDIGTFNWGYPIGLINQDFVCDPLDLDSAYQSIPLIQTFLVQPALGISESPNSPSYLQALTMFNYIVRINSRNVSYEPADLSLVLTAMKEIYGFIAWAGRIYQIANSFSALNRAVPDLLMYANYVDMSDIRKNLEDFRSWLNIFSSKVGLLAIPKGVPYFDRQVQLYSTLYADENSEKAQLYMFVPDVFYMYDEIGSDQGGRLIPIPVRDVSHTNYPDEYDYQQQTSTYTSGGSMKPPWIPRAARLTFADVRRIGENMLTPLLGSEDVSKMCSDIYKAYGSNNLIKLPMMPENATIMARHDYRMLEQIENMMILPHAMCYESISSGTFGFNGRYYPPMSQNPSLNKGNLVFTYNIPNKYSSDADSAWKLKNYRSLWGMYTKGKVLNVHGDEEVDPSRIMNMTRLVPSFGTTIPSSINRANIPIKSCGTELVVDSYLWSYTYTDKTIRSIQESKALYYLHEMTNLSTNFAAMIKPIISTTQFNYSPESYLYTPIKSATTGHGFETFQNWCLDRFVRISNYDVERLHEVMLLGLYRTPGYTTSVVE